MIAACGPNEITHSSNNLLDQAHRLSNSKIIVDTHVDVPFRLHQKWTDLAHMTEDGHFDYPRAVTGGLNAAFMSIYVPADLEAQGQSKVFADNLIDIVEHIAANAPQKFAVAYSPGDVERHFDEELISLPMGMENGSPIEGDLSNIQHFYNRGIRYITLAHSLSNHISDSSSDDNKRWGGLSKFGVRVVKEMNRLGMIIDTSHLSDEAFWDILDISTAPVIASHSSARFFTPGWGRNMSDDMIKGLADNGGVIMIAFGSVFLTKEAQNYTTERNDAFEVYVEQFGFEETADLKNRFYDEYAAEHGQYPIAHSDHVLDHIDHVVKLVGIDHVGIGSDYDGVDNLPHGLEDVASYPNLIKGMLDRGYSEQEVGKILGENFLRVWREVEMSTPSE